MAGAFGADVRHPHRKPFAPPDARETMSGSDFWRDLAEKFRAVDPYQLLRADWHCTVKVGEQRPNVAEWRIVGTDRKTRSYQYEFEALARRGGPEIYPYMDSLTGWLEALRYYRLNAEDQPPIQCDSDGRTVAHMYNGSIMSICQASVDLCKLLESQALEMERMEDVRREAQAKADQQSVYQAEMESYCADNDGSACDANVGQAVTPHQQNALETREFRLQLFLAEKNTTIAAVRRAAGVHKANMQQWRHSALSDSSVMSERIEDVLSGKRPID
jgi:hypothetical protein